jgi:hypothetical protein
MNEDDFQKIMLCADGLDPVWEKHFYMPLMSVLEVAGKKYHAQARPQSLGEARDFATKLWECHDEADMKCLVEAFPEAASQFAYVLLVTALQLLPEHREHSLGVEPLSDKPFSALAFCGLEYLDAIEAKTPGKTLPHR